jgi:Adenylosuccinate lyase C-terminal.
LKITGLWWQKLFKPCCAAKTIPTPTEALKELTRGAAGINKQSMHQFIDSLKVSATLKKELKKITPQNYTGIIPDM